MNNIKGLKKVSFVHFDSYLREIINCCNDIMNKTRWGSEKKINKIFTTKKNNNQNNNKVP